MSESSFGNGRYGNTWNIPAPVANFERGGFMQYFKRKRPFHAIPTLPKEEPKIEDPALPPLDPAQAAATALAAPAPAAMAAPAAMMGHADTAGGSNLADMFGTTAATRKVNTAATAQPRASTLKVF